MPRPTINESTIDAVVGFCCKLLALLFLFAGVVLLLWGAAGSIMMVFKVPTLQSFMAAAMATILLFGVGVVLTALAAPIWFAPRYLEELKALRRDTYKLTQHSEVIRALAKVQAQALVKRRTVTANGG